MRYLISYDLDYNKNYDALWTRLRELGGQRVLLSQWVMRRYDTSAAALRDYIWQVMDKDDRILVVCLDSTDWAGYRLMVDPNTI